MALRTNINIYCKLIFYILQNIAKLERIKKYTINVEKILPLKGQMFSDVKSVYFIKKKDTGVTYVL